MTAIGVCVLFSQVRFERSTASAQPSEGLSQTGNDCPDCVEGPFIIPHTGDPEIDQAYRDAVRDTLAARRARYQQEALQEHLKKRESWQGTRVEPMEHIYDMTEQQRQSLRPFMVLFETDPPAPRKRREWFAEYLQPDSPYRCVSWRCYLLSATEVDDGWLVDTRFQVNLMGPSPKFAYTDRSTNEIWHVSLEGELTLVSVEEGSEGIFGLP